MIFRILALYFQCETVNTVPPAGQLPELFCTRWRLNRSLYIYSRVCGAHAALTWYTALNTIILDDWMRVFRAEDLDSENKALWTSAWIFSVLLDSFHFRREEMWKGGTFLRFLWICKPGNPLRKGA